MSGRGLLACSTANGRPSTYTCASMGDPVFGSIAQPLIAAAPTLALATSSAPNGLFVTVTVLQPSTLFAPAPTLMPYAHTECVPCGTLIVESKPCALPKPGYALATSSRTP